MGKLLRDEQLYRETTAAMTNLREIMEKINRGNGLAGKVVNDETFYKNVKGTLQKVEKATDSLEDQGRSR
jgi:phospholipid/cholesterol/gamma-HCH transport system substrate-binding protein